MAGIKDGISGKLASEEAPIIDDLSKDQFISIGDINVNEGLEYEDVQTEAFYVTPVWKWMVSAKSDVKEFIDELYKIKELDPEGNNRSNFGGWQSKDDLHLRTEFKDITQMVLNIAEVQIHNQPWECIGMWANINPPGAGNQVHMHEGVFSGVLWLQCDPEKSGGLAFIDPRIRSKMSGQRGSFIFQTNNKGYHPLAGMGVLFPCWMEHYVMENKDNKDRISLSFNII